METQDERRKRLTAMAMNRIAFVCESANGKGTKEAQEIANRASGVNLKKSVPIHKINGAA